MYVQVCTVKCSMLYIDQDYFGCKNRNSRLFHAGPYFAETCQTIDMKTLIAVFLWFILLVICWPLALIALILFPLIWLITLPFRILGLTIDFVFKFITALFMLPFRLLKAA